MAPVIEVTDLTISVGLSDGGRAKVVDRFDMTLEAGATLGLVGESGSGKSMTSLAILGLLPPGARVDDGRILLNGEDLLRKSPKEMQRVRGSQLSMVLQDPMTALDPSFTIGSQLAQPLRHHRNLRGQALETHVVQALEQVHLSGARHRVTQYPHQLSGGMRQRATSAIALAGAPSVLIADEPTTALDVTTQARYLQLLRELQLTDGFALILISHDLMLVRHMCERVVVMYSGQVVEEGLVDGVFEAPQHPYTRALLGAIPELGRSGRLESIDGQAPDLADEIIGCRFASRCPVAREVCRTNPPRLAARPTGGRARCYGTEPNGWVTTLSTGNWP